MMETAKTFLVTWVVILLLNQVFIFGACFAPYCLAAAIPHTLLIAAVLSFCISKKRHRVAHDSVTRPKKAGAPKEVAPKPIKEELRRAEEEKDSCKDILYQMLDQMGGNDSFSEELNRISPSKTPVSDNLSFSEIAHSIDTSKDPKVLSAVFRKLIHYTGQKNVVYKKYLAKCFQHGLGTEKDNEKALKLYREAAGQGAVGLVDIIRNLALTVHGEIYEKYIGLEFEKRDYLVIYNGLIEGVRDRGVDLITITPNLKEVNLVQCKNWNKKRLAVEDVKTIYSKMETFNFQIYAPTVDAKSVQKFSQLKKYSLDRILEVLQKVQRQKDNIIVRKTLYIASDKVVDLEMGRYLKMLSETIFRYDNLKIVITDKVSQQNPTETKQQDTEARSQLINIPATFNKYGVQSLWHMTHWQNVATIIKNGLLNNTVAYRTVNPVDISDQDVQYWRTKQESVYGRKLHDYTPAYINIRNPMLYVRKDIQHEICLIEISLDSLQEGNFIFTDGNAASKDTTVYSNIVNLKDLPWDVLNSSYWNDFEDGKRKRCAEVLVYPKIDPEHIMRIHCYSNQIRQKISTANVEILTSRNLFFD